MKLEIMKFAANKNYEGKTIEVQKISNSSTRVSNKQLFEVVTKMQQTITQILGAIHQINNRLDNIVKKNNLIE